MWKNWNPFRRKPKEDVDNASHKSGVSNGTGKENTLDIDRGSDRASSQSNVGSTLNSRKSYDTNFSDYSKETGQHRNGLQQSDSDSQSFGTDSEDINLHDSLFQSLDNSNTGRLSHVPRHGGIRSRTGMGLHDQLNTSLPAIRKTRSPRRPITSPLTDVQSKSSTLSSMKVKSGNQSFSGVHGPLLSTPLVPKVRRALETSAGLRSPQLMSPRGKPVGRSASLNYGTSLAKSTVGQIPWVRLKRRESIGLADIVSGNTPQSPNTVKLAAPDQQLLPAAPSFKTTPLIVTTEPSRARVVDTQTVVSALREKRKRFGPTTQDETVSEDAWINAAKRRRQDSSQSNASSVSIPSMPETLPNLMGTPGTSLLHIENLTDQRPSTVPAVDTFITHHQRDAGLGGDRTLRPQQHVYHPQQQPVEQLAGNKNNSKSVLRSIQSSLSSSLRARSNLAMLQQGGVDLKRIRQISQSRDTMRRMSFSSDITMADQSFEEPPVKKTVPAPPPVQSIMPAQTTESEAVVATTSPPTNSMTTSSTVSTPVKRKIAEGVVLRKHNLSIGTSNSPIRPMKVLPASALVTTTDFERDREKEYQRRVLDMLENEESSEKTASSGDTTSSATSSVFTAVSVTPTVSQVTAAISSAVTTAGTISSTLDSLNKLVQSATSSTQPSSLSTSTSLVSGTSVSTANTLQQLLKNDEGSSTSSNQQPTVTSSTLTLTGKPLASPSSMPTTSSQQGFIGFGTNTISSQASVPAPATAAPSSASRGLDFSVTPSTAPQSSAASTPSTGFQINFGAPSSSAISFGSARPASTAAPIVTTSTPQSGLAVSGGFTFSQVAGQPASSTTSTASTTAASGSVLTGMSQTSMPGAISSGIQFGVAPSTAASQPTSQPSQQVSQGFSVSFLSAVTKPTSAAFNPGSFSLAPTSQPSATNSQAALGSSLAGRTTTTASSTGFPALPVSFTFTSTPQSTNSGAPATQAVIAPTFSLGAPTTTSSQAPMFNFGQSSIASQPNFNFGTGTATATAATAVAATTTSSLPSGFTFGASNAPTTTASQPQAGFSFGLAQTMSNAPSTGNSTTTAMGLPAGPTGTGLGGFTGQTSTQGFSGFGAGVQTTRAMGFPGSGMPSSFGALSTQVVTSMSSQPSVTSVFGANTRLAQSNQQAFGATGVPPAYTPFGATTTTTHSTSPFNFGQTATTATAAKPFTFGATTNQPNPSPFGGVSGTAAAAPAPSFFGSGVPTTTTAPSIFGSGTTPAFGNTATAAALFGSPAPTTSPPAFGSTVGMSTFGAATTTTTQLSSVFGAASPPSNQPFTFGVGTQQQQQQQTSAFGAAPTPVFGSMASPGGTALFGAKPPAPAAFGTPTASPGPVFGAPNQTATTTGPSLFGSSFSGTTAFGSAANQQVKPFGAAAPTGFGSGSAHAFGATTQNSVFGSAVPNPASPFGAQTNTNQAPNPSPFGSVAGAGSVSVFGTAKPNPFGAPTTTQSGFDFSGGQTQQSNAFATQSTNLGSSGFNFGQSGTQPAAATGSTGGFNFAAQSPATPAFQSPAPGGFNFSAAAGAAPTFNFSGGTPGTPNMLTPLTPQAVPRPRAAARRPTRRGASRK